MTVMLKTRNGTLELLTSALAGDFKLTGLHVPDSPIFLAAALPLRREAGGLKPRLPGGRGLTLDAAMLSAAAEALELRAILATSRHPAAVAGKSATGFDLVEAVEISTGRKHLVAAQLVFLDYAAIRSETLATDADSNGCAVGIDHEDAQRRALLECIERDALALWWRGKMARPRLDLGLIDGHAPRLSWWLNDRSRPTVLLDITTNIGIPCVAAASCDPDGRHIAIGSAANPDMSDAAISAVTEMLQTEASMALAAHSAEPDIAEWFAKANLKTMAQFSPAGAQAGRPQAPADGPLQNLLDAGFAPLEVECTRPGDPLPCVRALVPGLATMRGTVPPERFAANGWTVPDKFEALDPF